MTMIRAMHYCPKKSMVELEEKKKKVTNSILISWKLWKWW